MWIFRGGEEPWAFGKVFVAPVAEGVEGLVEGGVNFDVFVGAFGGAGVVVEVEEFAAVAGFFDVAGLFFVLGVPAELEEVTGAGADHGFEEDLPAEDLGAFDLEEEAGDGVEFFGAGGLVFAAVFDLGFVAEFWAVVAEGVGFDAGAFGVLGCPPEDLGEGDEFFFDLAIAAFFGNDLWRSPGVVLDAVAGFYFMGFDFAPPFF